jgi:hypothetical protein
MLTGTVWPTGGISCFLVHFQHTSVVQISLSATILIASLQLGIVMAFQIALMDLMKLNTAVSKTLAQKKRPKLEVMKTVRQDFSSYLSANINL